MPNRAEILRARRDCVGAAEWQARLPVLRAQTLTLRELEVLRLLAEGLTNKAMAARLVVAPSTIKQHLKNICRKLAVHTRTQTVARARELNLL